MTDSHAHLVSDPVVGRIQEHLKEFKDNGGIHILNVPFDVESIGQVISQSIDFENSFPEMLVTSIGVHPEYIKGSRAEVEKCIEVILETLKTHKKRIKGIGECGLDYHSFKYSPELSKDEIEIVIENQKYLFRRQLEIAKENNLPLTIHTRDLEGESKCISDALKVVASIGEGQLRGCFHSYTGNIGLLEEILSLGFYIGFNGIVTYPKAENVREILRRTPLEKVLLETDCPYLPPQMARKGKRTSTKYGKPLDIMEIAEEVAKIKEVSLQKVLEVTDQNFKDLFLSN